MDAGVPARLLERHPQVVVGCQIGLVVVDPTDLHRLAFDRLADHVLDLAEQPPGQPRPSVSRHSINGRRLSTCSASPTLTASGVPCRRCMVGFPRRWSLSSSMSSWTRNPLWISSSVDRHALGHGNVGTERPTRRQAQCGSQGLARPRRVVRDQVVEMPCVVPCRGGNGRSPPPCRPDTARARLPHGRSRRRAMPPGLALSQVTVTTRTART